MNWFKKQMTKHYVKKRKAYFIGFGIALISVILMAIAFFVDELSGLTDVIYCGALDLGALTYADCSTQDLCAKAQMAGIFWLGFGGLGMLMCFVAPALLGVKKSLSFIPYIFTIIFYILAIVMWTSDNPMCWGDNAVMGTSLYLAIVAICFAVIALIISALPFCKK
eukprot:197982_1